MNNDNDPSWATASFPVNDIDVWPDEDLGLDLEDPGMIWQPGNQRRELFIEFPHPRPRYEEGEIIRIRSETLSPGMLRCYRFTWLFRRFYHLFDRDDAAEETENVSAEFAFHPTMLDDHGLRGEDRSGLDG